MKKLTLICACAAMLAACGNNNDNNGTNNGATNNGGTNNGTANNGTANNGTTAPNNGTTAPNNGTTSSNNGTAATNNGTAATNNGTTATNNGTTATNNGTTAGAMHLEAHNCTFETATDMTGQATVDLTGITAWTIPHNVCLIVTTGTVVSWTGNFNSHPLDGGVDGTQEATNPIDIAGDGVTGNTTVDVTFDTAGDYPYYCSIHVGQMNGVVYVID